jgi:hypothetical protein
VLLGGYGTDSTGTGEAMAITGEAKEISVDNTVELLTNAKKVRHASIGPSSLWDVQLLCAEPSHLAWIVIYQGEVGR